MHFEYLRKTRKVLLRATVLAIWLGLIFFIPANLGAACGASLVIIVIVFLI